MDFHGLLVCFLPLQRAGSAGLITGLLHTKLGLNNLISGIVVTTGLFSIMLIIAGSTISLAGRSTIFAHGLGDARFLTILVPLIGAIVWAVHWFLRTEVGYLIQATLSF